MGSEEKMAELNVGGHVSLERKPRQAVERLASEGLSSLQIFASSPGAWRPPLLDPVAAADFVAARRENGIDPLFIHAVYLINLASPDPRLVSRSRHSLIATLKAGDSYRTRGVVTHIGSHGGRGFEAVRDLLVDGLNEILASTPPSVDLVLENSAGAGGLLGADLAELGALLEGAGRPPRLNVALDTAHLFGAGWDFRDSTVPGRLVAEIERHIGLDRLVVIHANDSKVPCGSRRDRHATIGQGHIGLEGLANLLAEPALRAVPWILETPDLDQRAEEARTLRRLAGAALDRMPHAS